MGYTHDEQVELLILQLDEMHDPYYRIISTRYEMNSSLIAGIGRSEWAYLLQEIVGRFVTEKRGTSIDVLYMELSESYPHYFNPDAINEEDQLQILIEFERNYRSLKNELLELDIQAYRMQFPRDKR